MTQSSPLPSTARNQINAALQALSEADRHIRLLVEIGDESAAELAARAEHLRRSLSLIRDEYYGQK